MQVYFNFIEVCVFFSGIIGQFEDVCLGSLLDEGELLIIFFDNSKMWVYFNVFEVIYFDYMKQVKFFIFVLLKLKLANNELFEYEGMVIVIEFDFNNVIGIILFWVIF